MSNRALRVSQVIALAAAGLLALLMGAPARADQPTRAPVVVELFTSQGCSSCPNADALLGELSKRADVLPFSVHVDYWNYIGWTDRFATEQTTKRQHAYKRILKTGYVYTPQMVIDGAAEVVGSDEAAVARAIGAAQATSGPHVPVSLAYHGTQLSIAIPEAAITGNAVIWLVALDRAHTTTITAGENTGRAITNYRVVRSYRDIGRWDGTTTRLILEEATGMIDEDADGCAVLLQAEGSGRILGAGLIWLKAAPNS